MLRSLSKSPNSASIRTFLAVELPEEVREKLAALERELRHHESVLKIVATDLLHVTVRFLGPVPAARMHSVEAAAARSAGAVVPFSLTLDTLGTFPSRGAPRVLWVGLVADEGYRRLQELFEHLEAELREEGFQPEGRDYAPHITIARVREGTAAAATRPLQETLDRLKVSSKVRATFDVSHLTVMRSDLSPRGPRYTPIVQQPLAGRVTQEGKADGS